MSSRHKIGGNEKPRPVHSVSAVDGHIRIWPARNELVDYVKDLLDRVPWGHLTAWNLDLFIFHPILWQVTSVVLEGVDEVYDEADWSVLLLADAEQILLAKPVAVRNDATLVRLIRKRTLEGRLAGDDWGARDWLTDGRALLPLSDVSKVPWCDS